MGFALSSMLFIDRMEKSVALEAHSPLMSDDMADSANGNRHPYDPETENEADTVVYRLSGAFFFGAASTVGGVLDRIADQHRNFVLDFSAVPVPLT